MSICRAHPWALLNGDCLECLRNQANAARVNLDRFRAAANDLGSTMTRVLELGHLPAEVHQEAQRALFRFRSWTEA